MFKNLFSFEGRIRRRDYIIRNLVGIIVGIVLLILPLFILLYTIHILYPLPSQSGMMGMILHSPLFNFMNLSLFLIMSIFFLAQGAKRCHDIGDSGWYQLIPFYGLWMLFADSNKGKNKYGKNPKGIGNEEKESSI